MFKRNRPYLHFTDRPLFKLVGILLTVAYFVVGYFYVFLGLNLGVDSLLGLIYPCVMVVFWESMKRRCFWPAWLVCSSICLLLLNRFDGTTLIGIIAVNTYWISGFVCCLCLIIACSRAEWKVRNRDKDAVVSEVTIHDPVKDAFWSSYLRMSEKSGTDFRSTFL